MASGNSKYHLAMSRVQKLPPIREETPGGLSRSTYTGVKQKTKLGTRSYDNPVKQRAVIHVRTLPEKNHSVYHHVVLPPPQHTKTIAIPKEPMDISHTLVDGLVADYLHYARYGHIIPVYEGSSTVTCPCCTDRNRENVRSLLGFQNADGKRDSREEPLSSRAKPVSVPASSTGRSWMAHQPLPYASNYLNPEFNRPSVVHNYFEDVSTKRDTIISGAVIDAGSKYDCAMKKLQKFGRESSLNTSDYRSRTPD